jgi:hypothetical protein
MLLWARNRWTGVAVGKMNVALSRKQMNWAGSWKNECCFEQEANELVLAFGEVNVALSKKQRNWW